MKNLDLFLAVPIFIGCVVFLVYNVKKFIEEIKQ